MVSIYITNLDFPMKTQKWTHPSSGLRDWSALDRMTSTRDPKQLIVRTTHSVCIWKKTCLLVQQEDMWSCWTRIQVFLFSKKPCLLVQNIVQQEDTYSWPTRRNTYVFLFNKKACLLAEQEDMSCPARRNKYVFSFNKKTCLLLQQEDMSSCAVNTQ